MKLNVISKLNISNDFYTFLPFALIDMVDFLNAKSEWWLHHWLKIFNSLKYENFLKQSDNQILWPGSPFCLTPMGGPQCTGCSGHVL